MQFFRYNKRNLDERNNRNMQINSLEFIFGFLPLFLVIYYLIKEQYRGCVLLIGSLAFYGLSSGGNYWWPILLAGVTLASYFASRFLGRHRKPWLLAFGLALPAVLLIFFKLYDGGKHLPAGMSFFLFQIAAILIDVYRGKVKAEQNFVRFSNQVVMFPKLLSGPIADPVALYEQERNWNNTWDRFAVGMQNLILGLSLKVLLAGRIGGIWSQANLIGFTSISTPYAWCALIGWTMELYFDFYGYSLMAIGLGQMLGYDLPANFLTPYASGSVSEFYRRWHVTLGAWFRNYLYIPLGGNRKGILRTILNLAVVWLFTGLWHGVGGNYLLWALFLFLLIVNERLWLNRVLEKIGPFRHVYVIFVILLSWIPFAVGDFGRMLELIRKLFGGDGTINPMDYRELSNYIPMLLAGILLATPLPSRLWNKIRRTPWSFAILLVLFWVVVYYISTAAQDPFLYFKY